MRERYEGKGAYVQVAACSRLPLVGPEEWDLLEEGKMCLTTTGLLMEDAEATEEHAEECNEESGIPH